ncbi:hypothetical protein SAMN02927900_05880 [Rhizobium mongolense subsp. loessense]|uniref:Uncharacterized protein n=1 Tax=Rhizobium mongolense subsp. loessense TaxID=158890 RepID=A0A1G4TZT4_9HYPH|nr:hypothetical protein [Rhizobium mongolense]SCW86848.1 hypothetical protein SAMN02927900_05880 [Rhizobium mongolense subsp. loessense]
MNDLSFLSDSSSTSAQDSTVEVKIDPIYAFELVAGMADDLAFEATEEAAYKVALAHRQELFARDGLKFKAPTAIYKVWLKPIHAALLLDVMNFPDERADDRLVERKVRIGLVTE